uniref:Plastid light harvesting protein n=1 Tax=Corethron hystrix TaxID=216773 RepID=A0A6U5L4A5_9STRA|mmetsp:Transcript_42041/g.98499  ORF Transcript_42041/g.98499 Transcript_42041/m.98499 type:complete len:239 (+) Transcript_42041:589-1305(+)|eukprot:CAMPEP_0113305580 /NCGR_PEP_ID=MMETSP0010_2-20120614/5153_1 /TAXON_ID=216773 ORGANISM="Corethron hystrix, Strain 308" /NCGR_SAMPLE_ID=MMETSP0010_2 /ASSEMBLY_ACC=CAM_ASM_000155 /LENGTH=238 /DNA_ID=CAMNT_0000160033 /DNA_START=565 /DNA_END=1281 /DNA_ORIENTATION=- /assembly_acc=CAM_ASM_000155
MKLCLTAALLPASAAFVAPSGKPSTTKTSLQAADLNGWVPDESKFAWGLPGSLDPAEDFDPFGFADETDLTQMKYYREAETTHGRVAMLAVVGFLVTEAPFSFHPLFDTAGRDIGPAIRHLDEVRVSTPFFFEILALVIGGAELTRSLVGWETPGNESNRALKEDYYPGDIGFDPLGLKPKTFEEFSAMSTKELQNGRLAMLGIAGIVAQEFINGKEIFVNAGLAPDTFDPSSLPVTF